VVDEYAKIIVEGIEELMDSKNIIGKTQERQVWIDVYKGIAIILVVLGHLGIPTLLHRFIYLFHMYSFSLYQE